MEGCPSVAKVKGEKFFFFQKQHGEGKPEECGDFEQNVDENFHLVRHLGQQTVRTAVLRIRIRDPCLFVPWIREPGWRKKSRTRSGMNIPNHISESLETLFWVKNTSIL